MRTLLALIFLALSACHVDAQSMHRFVVDRVIDADTLEGTLWTSDGWHKHEFQIRLDCIQSPESRGGGKTPEGRMLTGLVAYWIEGREVMVEDRGDGGFGRMLGRVYPPGWDESLSQRLHRLHWWRSPLYTGSQTTRAKIAACERWMAQ